MGVVLCLASGVSENVVSKYPYIWEDGFWVIHTDLVLMACLFGLEKRSQENAMPGIRAVWYIEQLMVVRLATPVFLSE